MSPTPRTQDSDPASQQVLGYSPNTRQQLAQLNRPMTSRFSAMPKVEKKEKVKKRVTFEDLSMLAKVDREAQLEQEERDAIARHAKERAKSQKRRERNESKKLRNDDQSPSKNILKKRTRQAAPVYDLESDEEVMPVKRQKVVRHATEVAEVIRGGCTNIKTGPQMSAEAQKHFKRLESLF